MIRRGVTIVEMLVVVAIVGVMAAISFPSINAGISSVRLHSAADAVAAFLSGAADRSQRRGEVIEVVVDPEARRLALYSTQPGFERILDLPQGISIAAEDKHHWMLMPGGSFPRVAVDLVNARGARKRIVVDPITGVPRIGNVP